MKATVDAIFEDGVFKPEHRPELSDGDRVRITVETVVQELPDDALRLAANVYQGLSTQDIDDIEEMARHRDWFGDRRL
jgi:predicted DNA-binding antitoxin AbrB/MazE fold protein